MTTAQLPASFIAKSMQDPSRRVAGAPANFGREVLPHIFTVSGRISDSAHTYPWYDQALADNRENAEMMRSECGIMECLEARQRGTSLLRWHIEPRDSKDLAAKDLARKVTDIVQETWQFLELRRNLLEALWYGRYMTSHRFGTANIGGVNRQFIRRWTPRNGDKLVFRYDDGTGEYSDDQVGIRVSHNYRNGETDWQGAARRKTVATQHGLVYFLDDWERQMVAVHRHMIEDSSFYNVRDTGRVNGVGIRDRIYWTWYAMQECLGQLMNFIERSAYGIEIWKFPAGNPIAEKRTIDAAQNRSSKSIILVPVQPGEMADMQDVQIIEPGMAGAEAVINLIQNFFGHKIKRYILGQTLTSEAAGTGLGSGVADAHMATYADIILFDAIKLAETITTDIVRPSQIFNFPDSSDVRLVFRIDTQAEDMDRKLGAWERAWNMGAELPVSDVMAMIGARVADSDERTLKNPQLSQAAQQAMQQQQAMGADAGGQWKPGAAKVFPPMGDKAKGSILDGVHAKGGDGALDKYAATAADIDAAASKTDDPTDAQRDQGNYRKGKVRLHGLQISIETPRGRSRRPEWPPMAAHYGYVLGTEGRDGDHVDVFIGPHPESELVFVVDQETQSGRFDEHKCMLGFTNEAEALECYRACYTPDWRVGPVTAMTIDQFKSWLSNGKQHERVEGQVSRYAAQRGLFEEDEHPRNNDGKFTKKGGGASFTEPGEFQLSGKSKTSGPKFENANGKQGSLFAKQGLPGQMNLFADAGVPDDLLSRDQRAARQTEESRQSGPVDHIQFKRDFDAAYKTLEGGNGETSHRGLVSFHDLRAALPHYTREQFNAGVRKLREDDHYTAETPHKQTAPGVREAGIQEGPDNFVWLSRKYWAREVQQPERYARQKRFDDQFKDNAKSQQRFLWITIGGEASEDGGKHHGGTHVQIDTQNGDIVAGPRELAEQGITNLKHFAEGPEKKEEQPPEPAKEEVSDRKFMTAGEAAKAGKSFNEWQSDAVDAFRNEEIDEDHPAWQATLAGISPGVREYNNARDLFGHHVVGYGGHFGKVTDVRDDGKALIVTHSDGETSLQDPNGVGHLGATIADRIDRGRPVDAHMAYLAPHLAEEAERNDESISQVMERHGIPPIHEAARKAVADAFDSRSKQQPETKGKEAEPPAPETPAEKEPWQHTRGEWHAAQRQQPGYDVYQANRQHKQAVADAIRSGHDVPAEAYQDYSDLAEMAHQKREAQEAESGPQQPEMVPLEVDGESDQSPTDELASESSEPDPWGAPGEPVEDTPRDEAAVATEQALSDDSEYAFARQSEITNVGEDVLGSARHRVNAWRGLQEAEQNGTAAEMVTRENLLKNEPHALMTHVAKHPLTALAMHHAIKAFPAKPGYGKRYSPDEGTAQKDRREYVEAYQKIKTEAERLAATRSDPIEATNDLRGHVSKLINEMRSRKIKSEHSIAEYSDQYNNTANSLVNLSKSLRQRGPNSVLGQTAKFAAAFKDRYQEELSNTDKLDKVTQHVSDLLEGKSFPQSLGIKGQGGSKGQSITPADLYVNKAVRVGGKSLDNESPKELTDTLTGDMGMRAIQWGNSVSDDERKHHLTRATESLIDLADVVGLPMSAISGEGTLALAIGARGTGRALAHYEPTRKIINLTRKNGVGSLAHEWGHFFDHWMGGLDVSKEGGHYHSNQLAKERFTKTEDGKWKTDAKGKMVTEDLSSDPKWKAFDDVRKAWKESGFHSRLQTSLNKAVEDGVLKRAKGSGTSFGTTGYWSCNQEMFARTFERYVQHKLQSDGRENTYLSGYDQSKDEQYGLWPTDDEVAKMAPAFDRLFQTVRGEQYGHLSDKSIQFENDFSRSFNEAYQKVTKSEKQPPTSGYSEAPTKPAKPAKEPTDAFHKAVVAAVGDNPEDVKGFKSLALEVWDRKRKEAEDNNHALRNLLSNFGVDGKRQGAFIQQVRRADDPDKIPKFDQMVEMAVRDYPGLLEYDMGESAGKNDSETALFNRLHRGLQEVPAKHSDEVIQEALDYVNAAERASSSVAQQHGDWETQPFARKSNEWWSLVKYAASQWRTRVKLLVQ